jgi:glycosyltransferase involved in cell wall biosynthesis
MNILITSPSLDEFKNVSGISSIVSSIINYKQTENAYYHFNVGKKDSNKRRLNWILDQIVLLPRLFFTVNSNKIQLVHLNSSLNPNAIVRDIQIIFFLKYVLRKKIILHVHGGLYLMKPPGHHSIFAKLIPLMLKNADKLIVLSNIENVTLKNNYNTESVVLSNIVNPVFDIIEKDFSGKLNFIFIGRIVNSKGIQIITGAIKILKEYYNEFCLNIYGTGPELNAMIKDLQNCDGFQFKYHGVVKGNDKRKAFEDSHIYLLPSLYGEGLPIAMLEAMNYGCIPIVSSDASISSVISNMKNGFILETTSEEDLKSVIIKVLTYRTSLNPISNSARHTIQEKHNIDDYIRNLFLYYIST